MRTAFVAVMCSAVTGFLALPPAFAEQKEKTCRTDWQANKAIYQPKGYTEQEYIYECRTFRTAPTAADVEAAPSAADVKPAHTRARPPATPAQRPK
jgi:hypothetical protein